MISSVFIFQFLSIRVTRLLITIIVSFFIINPSMSGWEWRKISWGAKLMKGMTFERRFNIHWMFLVLIIALSFHTPRSRIINLCFGYVSI